MRLSAAVFLVLLAAAFAAAEITVITHTPPGDVPFGTWTSWSALDDNSPPYVSGYSWDYWFPACFPAGQEPAVGTVVNAIGGAWGSNESIVGQQVVRCVATHVQPSPTYGNPRPTPVPPTTRKVVLNVVPPSSDPLIDATGPVDITAGSYAVLTYQMMTSAGRCGPNGTGNPQRRITGHTLTSPRIGVRKLPDSDWAESATALLYQASGKLIDFKSLDCSLADWAAVPIGAIFEEFTEEHRILVPGPCGATVTCVLSTHRFAKTKTSDTKWSIAEQN